MIRKRRKVRKPSWRWEIIDNAYQRFPDGREVCLNNAAGQAEYHRRTIEMARRQHWVCGLAAYGKCLRPGIGLVEGHELLGPTFEHFNKRGAGKRTDSVDPAVRNCAAHAVCNGALGSSRLNQ
jgi:hypothetical protein